MDPEGTPTSAPADAPSPALYSGAALYPGAPDVSRPEREAPQAEQSPDEHDDTGSN